jgi:hypothetical protein
MTLGECWAEEVPQRGGWWNSSMALHMSIALNGSFQVSAMAASTSASEALSSSSSSWSPNRVWKSTSSLAGLLGGVLNG